MFGPKEVTELRTIATLPSAENVSRQFSELMAEIKALRHEVGELRRMVERPIDSDQRQE